MSDRRRSILHLITRLELGGAQQNTLYATAQHDRRRFTVALIAGAGGELDRDARALEDAEVHLVPWLRHEVAPLRDGLALLRLVHHFRSRRVDLVHTHSSKAGIVGRVAAYLARVPAIVHTVHGWSFNPTQSPTRRRLYAGLERAAARITSRIVVVSSADRAKGLAARIGRPPQYRLIRSGIDVGAFAHPATPRDEVRRALGFGPEHRVVGTLACLKPQKAPLDFVEAAAAVYAREPRARFFVAGDGGLRDALERRLGELGLNGIVRVLGWRRDAVDLLHAMDVFLLTSVFEGLPRAVLQAMAAGVPVVATAVDGTPEVVRDGESGRLVPPRQPAIAAERLLELLADGDLARRCVAGARRMLTDEFDIRVMARQLDDLYEELLGNGGQRGEAPTETARA